MDRCYVTGHATSLLEANWFVECLLYDVTGEQCRKEHIATYCQQSLTYFSHLTDSPPVLDHSECVSGPIKCPRLLITVHIKQTEC